MSSEEKIRAVVTGGAGFIGSHLCEDLIESGSHVVIFDNFKTGTDRNLTNLFGNRSISIVKGDCKIAADLARATANADIIFHFAANPEARIDRSDPQTIFDENVVSTRVVLEATRMSNSINKIVFASSSTVYGEASVRPTHLGTCSRAGSGARKGRWRHERTRERLAK